MSAIERPADDFIGTVANGSTTYVGCGGGDASLVECVHLQADAAFVGTITFEDSNFPDVAVGAAGAAGDWIQENPTTGTYVAVEGAGWSVVGLTITVAGGAAGGAMVHLGNIGSRRLRAVWTATTGGRIRQRSHGKQ